MEIKQPAQLQKGTFLIASPNLDNGPFSRGVILLCEHSVQGSFGLLINKPLDFELPEEIIHLNTISNPHVGVRASGPVQTNQMMLLHTGTDTQQHMLTLTDGVYLGGDLQFLHDTLTDEKGPHITLCFGYAGWNSGQLEREFLDGSWFIYPSSKYFIFEVAPEKLWQMILRQMGGKYATLSMIPEDLSVN